jgi:site-specific DNA-methyltransferase (adenine-specific)
MERKEPISETYLMDCMDYMKQFPDKHFELAIVDPPYGIGFGQFNRTNKDSNGVRYKSNKYKNSNWDDSAPPQDYFIELQRVSKNQIIWGGNYFKSLHGLDNENLKEYNQFWDWVKQDTSTGWIVWYKRNPVPNFADCELAWTSFDTHVLFDYMYYGNINRDTVQLHPTQKPVALYKWLLHNYAKQGNKILDTHLGSQSSRIAAHQMGFDFYGTELDPDYFEQGNKRFEQYRSQLTLF